MDFFILKLLNINIPIKCMKITCKYITVQKKYINIAERNTT